MRIAAQSHAFSDRKFCGPRKILKFWARVAPKIARNLARRGKPMLAGDVEDLFASRHGRPSSGSAFCGPIARFFRTENFAAREKFRNFDSKSRRKSRAISHATASRCLPEILRTCLHLCRAESHLSCRKRDEGGTYLRIYVFTFLKT